jgi:hypothetical protein
MVGARRGGLVLPAALRARPFWLFGLPMVLFVVAGSLGLSQFAQAKYQVADTKRLVRGPLTPTHAAQAHRRR